VVLPALNNSILKPLQFTCVSDIHSIILEGGVNCSFSLSDPQASTPHKKEPHSHKLLPKVSVVIVSIPLSQTKKLG